MSLRYPIHLLTALLILASAQVAWTQNATTEPATTAPAASAPVDAQAAALADNAKDQQAILQQMASLPDLGTFDIHQVMRLKIEDGHLCVYTSLGETPRRAKLKLKDMTGFCTVQIQGKQGPGESRARLVNFEYWQFDRPGTLVVNTDLMAVAGNVQVTQSSESLGDNWNISLIDNRGLAAVNDPTPVHLHVQRYSTFGNSQPLRLELEAPTIADLRRQYAQETERYLRPILRDLRLNASLFAIDAKLAWQVFADRYPLDPALPAKVRALVAQLGSDEFKERERASAQLKAIGQPAAIVVQRLNDATLSPEQRNRIDNFLVPYRTLGPGDAHHLSTDVGFLLGCLDGDDDALRVVALDQLRKVTGQTLAFDLHASDDDRCLRVDQLRQQLLPPRATVPTTDH